MGNTKPMNEAATFASVSGSKITFLCYVLIYFIFPIASSQVSEPVQNSSSQAPITAGAQNGVTDKMRDDFLNRYRAAVASALPANYVNLVCLDKMDETTRIGATRMAENSLSYLTGRGDSLSFVWTDPNLTDGAVQERSGYRYKTNLKPAVVLTVNIKRQSNDPDNFPAALQPLLGVKDGRLYIVGLVREKVPEPTIVPKDEPRTAKSDNE